MSEIDPELYRLAIEQTKDYAVFILGPDGRIMTWGAGGQRIKGYTADEIIGRHFSVFYTHEAVESGWPGHELKIATTEGRFEDEGWRVRKDGSQFWANVVITALRDEDGKLRGFSKITRDLTERRMTEEALRQSEERFRLLVDGVADYAIYMLDPQGVITSWNTGAQRIKGYNRDEVIGKHFSRFYTEQDIAAGKPWEELATARRDGRAEEEGWRIKKNGERFWARVIVTPLFDAQGHMRGFAKVTQDLTERRYVQDLEQAARNVSEFISMLTHELRNPLAPIRTAMQVIGNMSVVDPKLDSMHKMIDRQSAQLSRILDDMMDVSRIARGKMTLDLKTIDLNDVIQRSAETAMPGIETHRHTLVMDLPKTELYVNGDFHRLTQLLANLLNNAARYTPKGGHITVAAGIEQDKAVVRVIDTGRGIEPEQRERIFSMFIQGNHSGDRPSGGLGIGLALARRIAELHNGSLQVHSEGLDKGSEFRLTLSLADASSKKRESGKSKEAIEPMSARRVLVVDDNVDAAIALGVLLRSLGHQTCVVHDGITALKMAPEFRPDVVLLDLGMPGMDGFETARRLRSLKRDRPFRIVAVTGWGQESDRVKTREAGFDLHLVKPVDMDVLAQALGKDDTITRTLH